MKNNRKQKIRKIAVVFLSFTIVANANLAVASEITSNKMVELTNASRKEAGLESLTVNAKLEQAAMAKANDMLAKQYFEHTSPEGVTPWYWFNQVGYEYVFAAENLAIDFITSEGAHSALMKSMGHRENILGANYKELGIAVASGEFKGNNSIIIVEEFGSQREHKITINNSPFFETVTEVKSELIPEVKPAAKVKVEETVQPKIESAPVRVDAPVIQMETQVIDDLTPILKEDIEIDLEKEVIYQDNDTQVVILGKVIPKVYAVKNVQQLKKVYVEDIYWENMGEDDLIESLNINAVKLKMFIRDLTGGVLQALL
ncbi:MAG: CAP domain-containing protein [Candidatus Pacebacteria bacterium]|jgi:uncharacterized protein YkwD|nr:CAP domain-containing protein [Candidatus Paceibacterota bacterium]